MFRGSTYTFDVSLINKNHPFQIDSVADSGNNINEAVAGPNDTVVLTIPQNYFYNKLYYYCSKHGAMGGAIQIQTP